MGALIVSNDFEITFDWLSRDHGDAQARATFAAMGIRVGMHAATEVEDLLAKTVRASVRASAHTLALWFAANWWRLRWEPETTRSPLWKLSHFLGAAGGGYAWPDLSFISDGSTIAVHCRPTPACGVEPVRFLADFDAAVPAAAFERGVDAFIGAVIERLAVQAPEHRHLRDLWKEVIEERGDREATEWRKLEAMLGFDPDEGPAEVIEGLRAQKGSVGSDAVEEVAAAASTAALDLLDFLEKKGKPRALPAQIPDYAALRNEMPGIVNAWQPPWKKAVQAARLVRERWRLGSGPISNATLMGLFSVQEEFFLDSCTDDHRPISAGYRSNGDGAIRVFLNKKHPTAMRFVLSRIVADHLYAQSGDRLLPATDAKTARQKFQRSFAQEFLCPFDDLKAHIDGRPLTDETIEEAAGRFEVSPLLTKTMLVNRGELARDVLEM
jgi:hypothetical protein